MGRRDAAAFQEIGTPFDDEEEEEVEEESLAAAAALAIVARTNASLGEESSSINDLAFPLSLFDCQEALFKRLEESNGRDEIFFGERTRA